MNILLDDTLCLVNVNGAFDQEEPLALEIGSTTLFFRPQKQVVFEKPGDYNISGQVWGPTRPLQPATLVITATDWNRSTACELRTSA